MNASSVTAPGTFSKRRLLRACFLCGLFSFLVSAMLSLMMLGQLVLLLNTFVPGFLFGAVVANSFPGLAPGRHLGFVLSSGALYIGCVWLATDIHLPHYGWMYFAAASAIGFCGLLVLYRFFIDRTLWLGRSLLFGLTLGILPAVLPGMAFDKGVIHSGVGEFPFDIVLVMSIYLLWQTAFGVTVVFNSPAAANEVPLS